MKKSKNKSYNEKTKISFLNIKNILKDKRINHTPYNDNIIKSTDMLYYPSKYPVGLKDKNFICHF